MNVSWFSTGVSSFIATYLSRKEIDKIIYINILDQHEDSIRFLHDCEERLDKKIEILESPYRSVDSVVRQFRYINGVAGAKCTLILKKRVREEWESKQTEPLNYFWGYDLSEKQRTDRIVEHLPKAKHLFPLAQKGLSKQDCHAMLARLGLRRPIMYDMGYRNNNCVGCVKGGMGYWNRIRVDFPEVFESRAKLEREIGASCLNGVYLDELEPNRGVFEQDIPQDCGMFCYLTVREDE
jgi:hypothetical protein